MLLQIGERLFILFEHGLKLPEIRTLIDVNTTLPLILLMLATANWRKISGRLFILFEHVLKVPEIRRT
ncbi:hypothetical protein P8452_19712 [Trifolium repens]|nr:hypothetical protein P8452_19712 [Trifolium repens]